MTTKMLDVVAPAPEGRERAARIVRLLRSAEERSAQTSAPAFYLSGRDEHDRVKLDVQLFQILKDVAEALSRGQAVSIIARDREISTQQAADLLGISRPTIVKLIEQGELPATVPGEMRRKLRLADVLAYRDRLYRARNDFIAESSAAYIDVAPDEAAALVEKARKAH